MRKALVVTSVAAVAGLTFAGSAYADACTPGVTCAATTIVTTVDVGTLAIAASPVSGSLSFTDALPTSGTTQSVTKSADLTLTTVTDTRLAGTGWSVTANMSALTGVPSGSIPRSALKLSVPSTTKVLGASGMVLSSLTTATSVNATTGDLASLVTASSTGGLNTVTYTPHIDITVPAGTAAGVYTGTLTQSVA